MKILGLIVYGGVGPIVRAALGDVGGALFLAAIPWPGLAYARPLFRWVA